MDYKKLKELTTKHSVAGDSSEIIQYISKELALSNIKFQVLNNNTIIAGNINNPKVLFTAHFDEVGFQVTQILNNGRIKFLPVGWVFPNRMNHQTIYIKSKDQQIKGVVLPDRELKVENIEDFNDLYISIGVDSIDEVNKLGITPGQTGTFTKEFHETENLIISSALDNKIAVLSLIEIAQTHPEFLVNNAIAFVTDEEMEDHSANGLGHKFNPDLVVVLDYCPVHHKLGAGDVINYETGKPLVMYRGGNYIIHEKVRTYFEDKIKTGFTRGFISSNTLPILEPSNFENNGHSVAVNLCLPAQGYHGESYLVKKSDIIGLEKLIVKIFKKEFK